MNASNRGVAIAELKKELRVQLRIEAAEWLALKLRIWQRK